MITHLPIVSLIFTALIFSSGVVFAEDDWDLEFDFSDNIKSTIEDFPLQEIGQDELSDAAIAGALQATSSNSSHKSTGKPIYVEQQEDDEKDKISLTNLKDKEELDIQGLEGIDQLIQPLQEFIQPTYSAPTLGDYHGTHTYKTVERF